MNSKSRRFGAGSVLLREAAREAAASREAIGATATAAKCSGASNGVDGPAAPQAGGIA